MDNMNQPNLTDDWVKAKRLFHRKRNHRCGLRAGVQAGFLRLFQSMMRGNLAIISLS